jgi:hypothetical protein
LPAPRSICRSSPSARVRGHCARPPERDDERGEDERGRGERGGENGAPGVPAGDGGAAGSGQEWEDARDPVGAALAREEEDRQERQGGDRDRPELASPVGVDSAGDHDSERGGTDEERLLDEDPER